MRKLEILLVCDMGIWYKLPINYQSNYSVCYHSDYQFGSYAFVDSPIDYQKRLPFGSLFLFSYYFAEIIVIGSVCTVTAL